MFVVLVCKLSRAKFGSSKVCDGEAYAMIFGRMRFYLLMDTRVKVDADRDFLIGRFSLHAHVHPESLVKAGSLFKDIVRAYKPEPIKVRRDMFVWSVERMLHCWHCIIRDQG